MLDDDQTPPVAELVYATVEPTQTSLRPVRVGIAGEPFTVTAVETVDVQPLAFVTE